MRGEKFWKVISETWERGFFSFIGLVLVGNSLRLIYLDQMTSAGIVFGLGFISFIYANVSRFKRFKGLGFEAELWEDKQKEAAALIERLKDVVAIYSREVVLGRVRSNRWINGTDWASHWQLYNDLIHQHGILCQKIDFSNLKKEMDDYFLFDMSVPPISELKNAVTQAKNIALQKIHAEFGNPIHDSVGYSKRVEQHRAISDDFGNLFAISVKGNLAGEALDWWREAKDRLKRDFDVDASIDPRVIERLEKISKLYQSRPVEVTDELIAWGNRRD